MHAGSRITDRVEGIAFGGEVWCERRVGCFVVPVPFRLTGEAVELELTEARESFALGRRVTSE